MINIYTLFNNLKWKVIYKNIPHSNYKQLTPYARCTLRHRPQPTKHIPICWSSTDDNACQLSVLLSRICIPISIAYRAKFQLELYTIPCTITNHKPPAPSLTLMRAAKYARRRRWVWVIGTTTVRRLCALMLCTLVEKRRS